jgi:hypothetical protein
MVEPLPSHEAAARGCFSPANREEIRTLSARVELLAMVPGWEDMQILEAVARLPIPEQAEAAELLSRYSPADFDG